MGRTLERGSVDKTKERTQGTMSLFVKVQKLEVQWWEYLLCYKHQVQWVGLLRYKQKVQ